MKLCLLQIDKDGSGHIELAELKEALDLCGFKIPQWKVRQMIDEYDLDKSGPGKGKMSFTEFQSVRKNTNGNLIHDSLSKYTCSKICTVHTRVSTDNTDDKVMIFHVIVRTICLFFK